MTVLVGKMFFLNPWDPEASSGWAICLAVLPVVSLFVYFAYFVLKPLIFMSGIRPGIHSDGTMDIKKNQKSHIQIHTFNDQFIFEYDQANMSDRGELVKANERSLGGSFTECFLKK